MAHNTTPTPESLLDLTMLHYRLVLPTLPLLQIPTTSDQFPPVTQVSGVTPNREYVASHKTSTEVPTDTAVSDNDPSVGGVKDGQSETMKDYSDASW